MKGVAGTGGGGTTMSGRRLSRKTRWVAQRRSHAERRRAPRVTEREEGDHWPTRDPSTRGGHPTWQA